MGEGFGFRTALVTSGLQDRIRVRWVPQCRGVRGTGLSSGRRINYLPGVILHGGRACRRVLCAEAVVLPILREVFERVRQSKAADVHANQVAAIPRVGRCDDSSACTVGERIRQTSTTDGWVRVDRNDYRYR